MTEPNGSIRTIPGLGFLLVIVLVSLIGWISSSFIVSRIVDVLDKVLEQTPGIKYIYSSVKDFLEAFGGNRRKFDKPVLVSVDAEDTWRIGFITQNDVSQFELARTRSSICAAFLCAYRRCIFCSKNKNETYKKYEQRRSNEVCYLRRRNTS